MDLKYGGKSNLNQHFSVHFITFGDGDPLARSASLRLKSQAQSTGWFKTTRAYGLATLLSDSTWFKTNGEFIIKHRRGFGYWIWKPFLIWRTLMSRPLNEFVIYLDAGY